MPFVLCKIQILQKSETAPLGLAHLSRKHLPQGASKDTEFRTFSAFRLERLSKQLRHKGILFYAQARKALRKRKQYTLKQI